MPTTYTHFAFGREVFELLDHDLRHELRPYMDYYNIGLHGPDILFYYHAFRKNNVNRRGSAIHHDKAAVFFRHAFSVFMEQEDKAAAKAYLAGFMTHYMLDSSCHPYINKRIRETGISHTEIETDLDSLLMRQDGLNPRTYRPAGHVKARWSLARLIAPFYELTSRQVWASLVDMKIVINFLFMSPLGIKRHFFALLGKKVRTDIKVTFHYAKPRINAGNRVTCQHLLTLYKDCVDECVPMVGGLCSALDSNDLSFCDDKRLQGLFA